MNENERKIHEYDAIRCELRENKKFIFERAALIIVGILAIINHVNDPIIYIFLPTIAIGLLIYNLLLTTNRFISSAHMAAYIAQFHEGDLENYWFGWERYLYQYRRFNADPEMKDVIEKIKKQFNDSKEPKSKYLFNYHRIFKFHVYCSAIFLILAGYNVWNNLSAGNLILIILSMLLIFLNIFLVIKYFSNRNSETHPQNIVSKIDYFHDFICNEILNYKNEQEKKKCAQIKKKTVY